MTLGGMNGIRMCIDNLANGTRIISQNPPAIPRVGDVIETEGITDGPYVTEVKWRFLDVIQNLDFPVEVIVTAEKPQNR